MYWLVAYIMALLLLTVLSLVFCGVAVKFRPPFYYWILVTICLADAVGIVFYASVLVVTPLSGPLKVFWSLQGISFLSLSSVSE